MPSGSVNFSTDCVQKMSNLKESVYPFFQSNFTGLTSVLLSKVQAESRPSRILALSVVHFSGGEGGGFETCYG